MDRRTRFGGRLRIALLLAGMVLLLGQAGGSARASGFTITGAVTLPGGSGVAGALVVATGGGPPLVATTGAGGAYALNVPTAGTYALTVRPPAVSTGSPAWVYTGEPVDLAVPDDTTQDFTVAEASVSVTGALDAPGSADFSGQNGAWVRAENQEGDGNTVRVDPATGAFSVRALPGPVLLRVTLQNQEWSAPVALSGLVYLGQPGETIQVQPNPLPVLQKGATIQGVVRVQTSAGVGQAAPAGVPVRAWRIDGADYAETVTGPDGSFTLRVISGTWALRASPQPNVTYGGNTAPTAVEPLTIDPQATGTYYVPAQPPTRAVLESESDVETRELLIAVADITVTGKAVSAATGDELTAADADGRVVAVYFQNGVPQAGPTAPLRDGAFGSGDVPPLRLSSTVAQTYTLGLYFPPDAPYTALARAPLRDLQPGSTLAVTLPAALDNSHISGRLVVRGGAAYPTGLPGVVWGVSSSGGWARTKVNPADGSYRIQVATTDVRGQGGSTWLVRALVDPISGYAVQQPRVQRVFLPYSGGEGAVAERIDFTLVQPQAFGSVVGVVRGPSGAPLPGVRVIAREQAAEGVTAFNRWAISGPGGTFQLRLPPGTYRISAADGLPLNLPRSLIPPAATSVTVESGQAVQANLSFRQRDATVQGQVTYSGAGKAALVRARSADGAVVTAPARQDGSYAIGLKAGLAWTLEAVSSDGSVFLRSDRQPITPAVGVQAGPSLALAPVATIPEHQAFVFDSSTDQSFTLGDGSRVQVPAGAMAPEDPARPSRAVLLTVNPLPELAGDGSVRPVSFGYRLKAYDQETRRMITSFFEPVTLSVPYTQAQLAALGVTESQLVPSYWDEGSASWKPVENVSVVPDGAGGGVVNIVVDHFTDFALVATGDTSLFLPLTTR